MPVESGGHVAILHSDRTQQFKSDCTFGTIILAIKSQGVLLKVIFIKCEVKSFALNCARGSGGCLAILCSDRTQQFKSDCAFGAIILAIK